MKFIDVLKAKTNDNLGTRTPIIAFLGDSVTQGCFEVYMKEGQLKTAFDSCAGYAERVKKIFSMLYPEAPISVVNMGVNGSTAPTGYDRLKNYLVAMKPDLLVVCFGLNDSNGEMEGLPIYREALKKIFAEAKEAGIETIFMTPNMFNVGTSHIPDDELLQSLGVMFGTRQQNGVFDAYMDAARELCREEGIRLCDCYAMWKKMYESGVDTDRLLSNDLNHPAREMHNLFAYELIKTIFED